MEFITTLSAPALAFVAAVVLAALALVSSLIIEGVR